MWKWSFLFLSFCFAMSSCSSFSRSQEEKVHIVKEVATPTAAPTTEEVAQEESAPGPSYTPDLRKRILVLPFLNKTLFGGTELSESAQSIVKSHVGKQPNVVMVDSPSTEDNRTFFNERGEYQWRSIFDYARVHGASGVISGSIEDLVMEESGDEVGIFRTRNSTVNAAVKVQLFDAETEKAILSRDATAEITEEATKLLGGRSPDAEDTSRAASAMRKAVEKGLEDLPIYLRRIAWAGRIAKIDFQRVYVNAGEQSGIRKGQLLKVFSEGQAITDNETGIMLGIAPGQFKGILRVIDYFGTDGAVAVVHSGAGFREKDRVQLYAP